MTSSGFLRPTSQENTSTSIIPANSDACQSAGVSGAHMLMSAERYPVSPTHRTVSSAPGTGRKNRS
jgi:hypothetical protein